MRILRVAAISVIATIGATAEGRAAICPVPTGSHPTIQVAIDDHGCTEIELGHQPYTESVEIDRTLSLSGVSSSTSIVAGPVIIEGAAAVVMLADLTVDGAHPSVAGCFPDAVGVADGARMLGMNIVVINGDGDACLLFGDGFEDGTTGAWSSTAP